MSPVARLIGSLLTIGAILLFWFVAFSIVLSLLGWPGR